MKGCMESSDFFLSLTVFLYFFFSPWFPKDYILRVKKRGSTKKYKREYATKTHNSEATTANV